MCWGNTSGFSGVDASGILTSTKVGGQILGARARLYSLIATALLLGCASLPATAQIVPDGSAGNGNSFGERPECAVARVNCGIGNDGREPGEEDGSDDDGDPTRGDDLPLPGGIDVVFPNLPPQLEGLVKELGVEGVGLLYRQAALLSQITNTAGSVASGLVQDIVSGALGDVLNNDLAAAIGPAAASSPGAASSMFMISGYKHLSHDGYSVSTPFNQAAGKSPEFEEDNYGLTIGLRFDGSEPFGAAKGTVTFGLLGNYTHTDVEVGSSGLPGPSQSGSASIDSWSVGGYGLATDGTRYGLVTLAGTFGSPETENALLPATADYGTIGFAASAMSGVLVPVGGAKLDFRGGLNYVTSRGDDYVDSVGSHYDDARMEEFSGTVSARLFSVVRLENYSVRPFVQGGLNHRFHYENEVTIDDVGFAFDDADTSVFGRAGIDFDVSQSMQAYLAVRGDASEDMRAFAAQVGVTFKLD